MSRVFVTGSSDGLGLMAAQLLIEQGHKVVLHARNQERARDAESGVPDAEATVVGDLASIAQTCRVAEEINLLGRFDAVIHNAGVGYREQRRIETEDGLPHVFAINTLAPYILTALIDKPKRLVYLSSGMHRGADASLQDITWTKRRWQGRKLTPRANCTTCCWRLPWPGAGRTCSPTRSSLAGCRPRWEGRAHQTRWIRRTERRCGWHQAMTQVRWSRASTSTTFADARRTQPFAIQRGRMHYWKHASTSRALASPTVKSTTAQVVPFSPLPSGRAWVHRGTWSH